MRFILRNTLEFAVIFGVWLALLNVIRPDSAGQWLPVCLLLAISVGKTLFFGNENLQQLWKASRQNMPYHRFMLLMLVNMSQIILSFGLDFHCLHRIDPASFSVDLQGQGLVREAFEFTYFSVLNFTFFGYGDVTPQTVAAKLLTMSEILLAFVTVIFLLSDFVSLKESICPPPPRNPGQGSPSQGSPSQGTPGQESPGSSTTGIVPSTGPGRTEQVR